MDDLAARTEIYRHFATTGQAPTRRWLGERGVVDVGETLQRLHDGHMIVLDDDGSIRMALPFSAHATDHLVSTHAQSWWANCAWDALAIVAALDIDARITSIWIDTGDAVDITITDRQLSSSEGYVHFAVPARRWWDDIVET